MKKNRFFLLLAAIVVTAAFASCNMGSSDVTPTALSIEMFPNAFKVGKNIHQMTMKSERRSEKNPIRS